MAKVFLTGLKANDSTKLHLYLPNIKQPVDLPSNGLARSHEEKRRSHISEDKANMNKLISRSVRHGKFWSKHTSSIDNTGVLNSILGRHPFPLGQGPIVIPLDNNAGWYCDRKIQLCPKEVFENRTIFNHADTQGCFEWVPTVTGNAAWNPDKLQDQMYDLQDLQNPDIIVQGPASTMTMGIVYTCNKLKCVVHCPCSVCNDNSKNCKLICHDEVCGGCNSQCLNHQIQLPRTFNSETDLFTFVTNHLDCYRFGIPYAGIPSSCSECTKDVMEHQKFHLVFHTRCRYCRYALRPFERRSIVTLDDYYKADKLLKDIEQRTCSYCLAQLRNKQYREQHEATVHQNMGKFKCDSCEKTYSNKNALSYHVSNKHNDKNKEEIPQCKLCESKFTTDESLCQHMETIHQGEGQKTIFECEKCGDNFSMKKSLTRHEKEKHYNSGKTNLDFVEDLDNLLQNKCDQCAKSFKRKYQIQRHKNTVHRDHDHEEKKPFKCSKCDCKYGSQDNLKRHEKQKHTE